MLKIFNTLTREKEVFKPIHEGKVGMYVCGVTVYDLCHIGHGRTFVCFDVIARYLRSLGYDLTYVRNITDVDDKIIKRALENKETCDQLVDRMVQEMYKDFDALNVLRPDFEPRATHHIPEIIEIVEKLIARGHAYVANNGDVMFDVESFKEYGKLSRQDLDQLQAGARIEINEIKKNPMDFVLWKMSKENEPSWPSPWGAGRPGWHIECSVMSTGILGDTIDIHGGGADLEFPHHTNEIAQSEAKTGKTFVNYWMHNGFVNIDNVKMSKSLGNFITVHDALKTIDGQVLRFFFATQHYRKPINFTEKAVRDAETNLKYLKNTYEQPFTGEVDPADLQGFVDKFIAAMDEDINAANGITVVFELAKWINSGHYNQDVKDALTKMLEVFGVVFVEEVLDADIEALIAERQEARAKKDFARADAIRDELAAQGIKLLDTKEGVRWTRD